MTHGPAGVGLGWLVMAACGAPGAAGPVDAPALGADAAPPPDARVDAAPPDAAPPPCPACATPGVPVDRGVVPASLTEASGLVASRLHPGVLYAHNDSGDDPRVIVFADDGTALGEIDVAGADHTDWEDIAVGPCPAGSCLYVGDIGDNGGGRATKTVYRFPEPAFEATQAAPTDVVATGVEAFPFKYPIGLAFFSNAETLLVHPETGAIYVVTKEDVGEPSTVYAFPATLTEGVTATLALVAELPFPTGEEPDISGGDIAPCGRALILRLGSVRAYELTVGADEPFEAIFTPGAGEQRALPLAAEANGEALTYASDGAGYFTVSEGGSAQLHYVGCT